MTDIGALFTFIFLLLFACVPAKIASSKGRDFLLWYVYGFFLFIFALIHSIVIDADNKAIESKKLNTREFKNVLTAPSSSVKRQQFAGFVILKCLPPIL